MQSTRSEVASELHPRMARCVTFLALPILVLYGDSYVALPLGQHSIHAIIAELLRHRRDASLASQCLHRACGIFQ